MGSRGSRAAPLSGARHRLQGRRASGGRIHRRGEAGTEHPAREGDRRDGLPASCGIDRSGAGGDPPARRRPRGAADSARPERADAGRRMSRAQPRVGLRPRARVPRPAWPSRLRLRRAAPVGVGRTGSRRARASAAPRARAGVAPGQLAGTGVRPKEAIACRPRLGPEPAHGRVERDRGRRLCVHPRPDVRGRLQSEPALVSALEGLDPRRCGGRAGPLPGRRGLRPRRRSAVDLAAHRPVDGVRLQASPFGSSRASRTRPASCRLPTRASTGQTVSQATIGPTTSSRAGTTPPT